MGLMLNAQILISEKFRNKILKSIFSFGINRFGYMVMILKRGSNERRKQAGLRKCQTPCLDGVS